MIQALTSEDPKIKQTTLSTLYILTLDAPDVIAANLPMLLPVYINLAKDQVRWQLG